MTKKCLRCKQEKELFQFSYNKNTKDGYCYWCKECAGEHNRQYYRRNRKKEIKRSNEYSRHGLYIKRWRKAHPIKTRYSNLKFRCKGKWDLMPREEFIKWYKAQPMKCYYCGITIEQIQLDGYRRGVAGKALTLDRLNPLKGYIKGNIVLACTICNFIKGNILSPEETKEIAQKYITPKIGTYDLQESSKVIKATPA